MAEKTYTLEQAAAKMGKSAEEFKEFVKNNSISELREGANVLYDAKEIDALSKSSLDDTVLNIEDSVIGLNDESSLLGLASLDESSDKDDEFEIDANMSSMVELTEADTRGELTSSKSEDDSILSLADSINSESNDDEAKINADSDIDTADDGSGSGLLDLSLQADDSQFGAVLDDILPGGDDDIGGFSDLDDSVPSSGSGFADDSDDSADSAKAASAIADVAEDKEEDYAVAVSQQSPQASPVVARMAPQMMEIDSTSGVFGASMLLALLATIFALIIITAGFKSITPSIFTPLQDYILYIFGGLAALSLLIAIIGSLTAGSGKEKKVKADKPKKAKKAKKKK